MAQDAEVMSFRKRLKKLGYRDIHIIADTENPGEYLVTVVEPFSLTVLSRKLSTIGMCHLCKPLRRPSKSRQDCPDIVIQIERDTNQGVTQRTLPEESG